MKKVFLLGITGALWSCSVHKSVSIPPSPCRDSAALIQDFKHIGGFQSANNVSYDVYLGVTSAKTNVLNIFKENKTWNCYLLGTGHLSYAPYYLADSLFQHGELFLYYSFTNDVQRVPYEDLRKMPSKIMEKYGIHSLNVKFE